MKHFIIPLLVCGLSVAARAQAPPGQALPADTARVFKHELGLTASPTLGHFFTANRSLPVGLLYKYHLSERHALRLRVVGRYGWLDSTYTPGYPKGNGGTDWETHLFAGYERHHRLSPHWVGYYGTEAGVGVQRQRTIFTKTPIFSLTDHPDTRGVYKTRKTTLHGRVLAGLTYFITPRFHAFAEASIATQYYWQSFSYVGVAEIIAFDGQIYPQEGSSRSYTSQRTTVWFHPVQLIGLSCDF